MTGEITLRGAILPIGGLKEKSLGAYRAGIKTIILPEANRKDTHDLPAELKKNMSYKYVDTIEQALKLALAPTKKAKSRKTKPKSKTKK